MVNNIFCKTLQKSLVDKFSLVALYRDYHNGLLEVFQNLVELIFHIVSLLNLQEKASVRPGEDSQEDVKPYIIGYHHKN